MTRAYSRSGLFVFGVCLTFCATAAIGGQQVAPQRIGGAVALAPTLTCVVLVWLVVHVLDIDLASEWDTPARIAAFIERQRHA